jgi:hypothetical protein
MLRAASRAADVVVAGDTMRQVIAHAAIHGTAMYRRTEDGSVTLVDTTPPDPLRSHPLWRRYVASFIRLRRVTDRTPKAIAGRIFVRTVELERDLMRATRLSFNQIFDAGEEAAEAVLRRYRH